MTFFAINGSPRKKYNTAKALQEALNGVKSVRAEAETKLIHLSDLNYSGCISCFACKRTNGKSYGKCAVKDDLFPLFQDLAQADGIIFGSPVYFAGVTGQMRSFLERLLFANYVYDGKRSSLAPKKMPTAFIYTMGVQLNMMHELEYPKELGRMDSFIEAILSKPRVQYICNTYQFDDYAKYHAPAFDVAAKTRQRDEEFPKDLKEAFDIGAEMARKAAG